jgi:hypothetical protein
MSRLLASLRKVGWLRSDEAFMILPLATKLEGKAGLAKYRDEFSTVI